MATAKQQQGPGPQFHGIRTNLDFAEIAQRDLKARKFGTGTPQLNVPLSKPRKKRS